MKKVLSFLFVLLLGFVSIYAMEESPQDLRVYLKTLLGKTISIDINESTTVYDLKKAIEKKERIPFADQIIVLEGKKLEPTNLRLIKDVKIQKYPAMHLVIKKPEPPLAKRFSFTPRQKIGATLTTAILLTAVAGVMKIHAYRNTKKRLIKKYNLGKFTPLQNKVWLATVLASYGIPWYLHYIVQHNESLLTDLVGTDPHAIAELYYGHIPALKEMNTFFAKFFSEK